MNRKQLNVTEEVYDKVIFECREAFLRDHPEFKDMKISHNFLVGRIARYYLGEKLE